MPIGDVPVLPVSAIFGILILGCALVLFRPYWAFLFCVVLSIGMSTQTMMLSRFPGLGPYFNAMDACVCIGVLAMIADCFATKRRVRVPPICTVIVVVIAVGYVNCLVNFGLSYDALRGLRSALNVPLFFVMAANLVVSDRRARVLFGALLIATVTAEVQHILEVTSAAVLREGEEESLRTMAYMGAYSVVWLVAGPYLASGKIRRPVIQFAAGSVFLLGNVLHQTRNVLLGACGALVIYYLYVLSGTRQHRSVRLLFTGAVLAVGLLVAVPRFGLEGFTESYAGRIERAVVGDASTRARQEAFELEIGDWLDGNVIVGRGLSYFATQEFSRTRSMRDVAYGHVGYVTYLSQLGVVGFIVYGLWLPGDMLRLGRRAFRDPTLTPAARHLAGISAALGVFCWFVFGFGSSFLAPQVLPGVLAGFLANACRDTRKLTKKTDSRLPASGWARQDVG